MIPLLWTATFLLLPLSPASDSPLAGDFERLALDESFHAEGANFADLDRDGHTDVVSGPWVYLGPEFERRLELYAPERFDPLHYSDSFFNWTRDLDGDGWLDVLQVGFPGAAAFWFENPGEGGGAWTRHLLHPTVDNESPLYVDLVGDAAPELVCNSGGAFGYLQAGDDPRAPWSFHAISPDLGKQRFTHGLGAGDLDGDGRADLLEKDGWWQQPAALAGDPLWQRHAFAFSNEIGGAQMLVSDVDGDGDNDVITSLHAHAWGLAWYEQVAGADGGLDFVQHRLMGATREASPYGVRFSSIHALALADVDGDGVDDLITGKRHWSHGPDGDPKPSGPSVLYWFRVERRADGVRFVPHLIDDDSGVGTQVVAGDVDGDGRVDVVVGNKAGTFVFLQSSAGASVAEPEPYVAQERESPNARGGRLPRDARGRPLNLGLESGDLSDWTCEGRAFEGQPVLGDTVVARGREPSQHVGRGWLGGYELLGDEPTGTITSASFELAGDWASFLVGGGASFETRVELVLEESGEPLVRVSGANSETMNVVVVDLREHRGERAFLRLVDEHTGGWGHVNFDDFLLHDEEPEVAPERRALGFDLVPNAGLTPREAAAAMTVPPGFHVDLIAAEPELHQPIALAIDERGRLWVAEAHTYPQRRPEGQGADKVLVFEDSDGDGEFDRRVLFAEGLNLVSGLAVGFGGVWIGAAPYLLFIPDRDGDLVPDGEPEVVLDGWGYQDTHETLNAFTWGPDGWLYGCHGVFTHSRVGAPGTPDEERVALNAGVWRLQPTSREFEVFAWGTSNPWGVDFDEEGQAFLTACVIPHLYHMAQGGRYERQAGSHFGAYVYEDIPTIADHRHYLGATPHAGNNKSSQAGGGHAHCGALVYLGDAFPEPYRGRILMNNIHGNRVNCDALVREGSGFVGRHEPDFLLANDRWYRGIALETGPDGAVYFIDWSDAQACHHTEVESWDRTNGRLYRVRYGDLAPAVVDLTRRSDAELVALLENDNAWFARNAQRVLQERGAEDVRGRLEELVREADAPRLRLRALWTLHVTSGLDEALCRELCAGADEDLAAWSVQLAAEDREVSARLAADWVELARRTTSPRVRLYLASALERMGARLAGGFELAGALLAQAEDEHDPNLSYLVWYGLSKLIEADPARGLELLREARLSRPRRLGLRQLASTAAGREQLCAQLAGSDAVWTGELLEALELELAGRPGVEAPRAWAAAYDRLRGDADRARREQALWIAAAFGDEQAAPELELIAADRAQPAARRVRALEALARTSADSLAPVFRAALTERELRGVAIAALARHSDAQVPAALLALYPELEAEERRAVCATLSSRIDYARALLAALERGELAREELSAFVLRKLRGFEDDELAARVAALYGIERATSEDKRARIAALVEEHSELDPARTRPAHGRLVFDAACGRCHTLFESGGDLAPDLTGSNRTDLDYLFTNMVDPNALIGRDYQVTIVRTFDGLLLNGVLKQENEDGLVLQSETETSVVALDEIEERVLSDVSIMPEGQIEALAPGELPDLVAYLTSSRQVAPPLTEFEPDLLFDGQSLAGWSGDGEVWRVEDGELVGQTEGLARNSFLVSEHELADFRFSCQVLLESDAGNSGIQFRSRDLGGGEVAGYQADIGAGWWGKLYEEHGRGLLTADETEVRRGEWNEYVIEARGSRLRTWLNGELCLDLDDPEGARSGVFALQVHSGGATCVRFRGLRVEALPVE